MKDNPILTKKGLSAVPERETATTRVDISGGKLVNKNVHAKLFRGKTKNLATIFENRVDKNYLYQEEHIPAWLGTRLMFDRRLVSLLL